MGRLRKFQFEHSVARGHAILPKELVLVDKKTGARRFEVKADKHGRHADGASGQPARYSLRGALSKSPRILE